MLLWFAKRLKELQEVERDERGFTLIELLIVIIILGILAAIALPTFLAQRDKAQAAKCKSDTRNAAEAAVLYAADNEPSNDYSGLTDVSQLNEQGFNQSEGLVTTVTVDATDPTILDISTDCDSPNITPATWSSFTPPTGVVTGAVVS
jgi:type IV pilus assembly protein PilA